MSSRSLIMLLAGVLPLAAQTSSLQGVVTDSQAGAVPEAIVTITNQSTSAARKSITDAAGGYSFLQVAPGSYRIAVEKPVHVHDIHATILYLFGIEHTKLTYRYSGRDFRLTDVAGNVLHDLIA